MASEYVNYVYSKLIKSSPEGGLAIVLTRPSAIQPGTQTLAAAIQTPKAHWHARLMYSRAVLMWLSLISALGIVKEKPSQATQVSDFQASGISVKEASLLTLLGAKSASTETQN
jgi:hypothetical protein